MRRFGARWLPVEPERSLHWHPPRRFGSIEIDLAGRLPRRSPEFGVLELEDGCLLGRHGWVIGAKGTLLPEFSWYGGPSERIRLPRRMPEPLRLPGRCLSLVSDWSSENYAHYLLDGLGRLALFSGTGASLSDVDHVCCPHPPSAAAGALLDLLGIPAQRRVWAARDLLVRAEVLVVPSFPAPSRAYQPWLARFLREAAASGDGAPPTRRLYISRRGAGRQAVPDEHLQRHLQDRGFELYEPSEHSTQPEDFRDAAVIVGAHGAGLANLAFCRPGTKILELIPTDNAYPHYYSLAATAGLDYGYLAGSSTSHRPAGSFGPSPYDFEIPPDEFAAALDELLRD